MLVHPRQIDGLIAELRDAAREPEIKRDRRCALELRTVESIASIQA